MLTSLSRRSSKATRLCIPSSRLNYILRARNSVPVTHQHAGRLATFSSTSTIAYPEDSKDDNQAAQADSAASSSVSGEGGKPDVISQNIPISRSPMKRQRAGRAFRATLDRSIEALRVSLSRHEANEKHVEASLSAPSPDSQGSKDGFNPVHTKTASEDGKSKAPKAIKPVATLTKASNQKAPKAPDPVAPPTKASKKTKSKSDPTPAAKSVDRIDTREKPSVASPRKARRKARKAGANVPLEVADDGRDSQDPRPAPKKASKKAKGKTFTVEGNDTDPSLTQPITKPRKKSEALKKVLAKSGETVVDTKSTSPKSQKKLASNETSGGETGEAPDVKQHKERQLLQWALEHGELSDADRRATLRKLRASLLSKYESGPKARSGLVRIISARPSRQSLVRTVSVESHLPRSNLRPRSGQALKNAMLQDENRTASGRPIDPTTPYRIARPIARSLQRRKTSSGSDLLPNVLKNAARRTKIETVNAEALELIPVKQEPLDVPSLDYGLERVLFNPGVYQLQDPRTQVFNFDPYLQSIMPVSEFDFNALKKYIAPAGDTNLLKITAAESKKYTGSTSSMTSALGHFHFLLSQFRPINLDNLSRTFPSGLNTFTAFQRAPVSVYLRWRDGVYAIDASKQFDKATILSMLGQSMEKLLTLPTEEFEKYRRENSDQISKAEREDPQEFHYTTIGDFLLRSQLDAHDPRLPGTGMFDLKTRAVISIRMDQKEYEVGRGYQIRGRHGEYESYEREYYDMIRSAFLKYSLQVRMGRMDGIFVAFHNTEQIFGFQYISLDEMDFCLHGASDRRIGDNEFKLSLDLLNRVLDKATEKYPEQSLKLHFETRDATTPFMYIFAQPMTEAAIERKQNTNKQSWIKFEKEVLGMDPAPSEKDRQAQWDAVSAQVEEAMATDEAETSTIEDDNGDSTEVDDFASSGALKESQDLESDLEAILNEEIVDSEEELNDEDDIVDAETTATSELESQLESEDSAEESSTADMAVEDAEESDIAAEESSKPKDLEDEEIEEAIVEDDNFIDEDAILASEPAKVKATKRPSVMAMTLTIRNLVDGDYVTMPDETNYPPGADWTVEYQLGEVYDAAQARRLYETSTDRLRLMSQKNERVPDSRFAAMLRGLSNEGRKWKQQQQEAHKDMPIRTVDQKPFSGPTYKSEEVTVEEDEASLTDGEQRG